MMFRSFPDPAPTDARGAQPPEADGPLRRNGSHPREAARDERDGTPHGTHSSDASTDARRPPKRSMVDDLADLVHDLRELASLQVEEARLLLRFKARRLFVLCVVAAAGAAALLLAIAACVRGMAGGFAAATGVPWMGDLLAGAATLALLATSFVLRGRHLEARALRRLERRFGRDVDPDVEPEMAS